MHRLLTVPFLAALAAAGSAQAQAQGFDPTWQFSTGADYSSGDYGGVSDTAVLRVPVEAKITTDRLRFELSVPWVRVDGPAQVVGGIPIGSPTGGTSERSGLGDVLGSAAATVLRSEDRRSAIELGGRAKVPTADDDIGTGKADFAATVSLRGAVSRTTTLFGSVGYEWLGDPEAYQVEDGVEASIGVNVSPSPKYSVGASVNFHQRYLEGGEDYVSVSPYVFTMLTDTTGLSVYGGAGLTESSPDAFAGIRLSVFR